MYCSKMVPVIFNNDNNGDLSQVSIYDKNKIRKKTMLPQLELYNQ